MQTNSVTRISNSGAGTLASLSLTTALTVANGGTGATTLTSNGVLYGNGTSAVGVTSAGTLGQVLTSNGSGAAPTFQAVYMQDPNYTSFIMPQSTGKSSGTVQVIVAEGLVGSGSTLTIGAGGPGVRPDTGATNNSLSAVGLIFSNAAAGLQWSRFRFARWTAVLGAVTQNKVNLQIGSTTLASVPAATERHIGFRVINVGAAANWFATNADGTTETSTDTGVLASTAADNVFVVTGDGTTLRYYINGVLAATHTTNLPTGATMDYLKAVNENTEAVNKILYVNEMLAVVTTP